MKFLVTPSGDLLSLPINWFGGTDFENIATGEKVAVGIVAERADRYVKALVANAHAKRETADDAKFGATNPETGARPYHADRAFSTSADAMREVRWINKALNAADAAVGTEVRLKDSGRGHSLDLPEAAPAEAYAPQVGDRIAIGPNITPKALMNARGEVLAVNGTRVKVRLTAGDLKRVKRATGKAFAAETSVPKVCIEKDEA